MYVHLGEKSRKQKMSALTLVLITVIASIDISATVHAAGVDVICPKKYQEGREIKIKASINLSKDIGEEDLTKHEMPVVNLNFSPGDSESIICNKTSSLGVCSCIKVQENILNCSLVLPDNRTRYEGAEVTFKYTSPPPTNGQCTEAEKCCRIKYEASSGADGQTSGRVFRVVIIILIAWTFRWLFC